MRDLGAVNTGAVRDVVGGGGIGACTLGFCAWDRGFLGAGLFGVGAGVLAVMFSTIGYVAGGDGCLGCVL